MPRASNHDPHKLTNVALTTARPRRVHAPGGAAGGGAAGGGARDETQLS